MPALKTLADAQAALDQAQARERDALVAYKLAQTEADELREQLANGSGAEITPADLVAADAKAEHARLAHQGTTGPLKTLGDAVARARAEELSDEIALQIPLLGAVLQEALDAVTVALEPVFPAADAYDQYVGDAVYRLERVALPLLNQPTDSGQTPWAAPRKGSTAESPFTGSPAKASEPERPQLDPFTRVHFRHMGTTTVDRIPVVPCRGAAQLAAVVLPAMRLLGASSGLIDHLKELAQSAPALPTN